jgi:hypothetical protein
VAGEREARLRAIFERFNRTRDLGLENFDPDIEWHLRADLRTPAPYAGTSSSSSYTATDEKVIELREYVTKDEALRSLGPSVE